VAARRHSAGGVDPAIRLTRVRLTAQFAAFRLLGRPSTNLLASLAGLVLSQVGAADAAGSTTAGAATAGQRPHMEGPAESPAGRGSAYEPDSGST
jgi:hypothetical protein